MVIAVGWESPRFRPPFASSLNMRGPTVCHYTPSHHSCLIALPPAGSRRHQELSFLPAASAGGITGRFSRCTSQRHQREELHLPRIVENA